MSKFKDWFTEDDDDIFFGSPKSKFFDILEQTHRDLVEDEIDKVIEKLAILELIISQDKDEDFDINSYLEEFKEKNEEDVNSIYAHSKTVKLETEIDSLFKQSSHILSSMPIYKRAALQVDLEFAYLQHFIKSRSCTFRFGTSTFSNFFDNF
mgnify:CR=1 FL=1